MIAPFTDSDSDNDHLPYNIVKIPPNYPQHYLYGENDNLFGTTMINTDEDRGYYVEGFKLHFFPASGTGEQEYYVTLKYLKFLDIDNYDKDTRLLYTNMGYVNTTKTVNDNPLTATATTVNANADISAVVHKGDYIKIDDEIMYVTNVVTTVITVVRGVNGTTGAEHLQTTEIYYTSGLFSWKFIRKAVRLAVDLLFAERNRRG